MFLFSDDDELKTSGIYSIIFLIFFGELLNKLSLKFNESFLDFFFFECFIFLFIGFSKLI